MEHGLTDVPDDHRRGGGNGPDGARRRNRDHHLADLPKHRIGVLEGAVFPLLGDGVPARGAVAATACPSVEAAHRILLAPQDPPRLQCAHRTEYTERRKPRKLYHGLCEDQLADQIGMSGRELQRDDCASALGYDGGGPPGEVLHECGKVLGVLIHSVGKRPT